VLARPVEADNEEHEDSDSELSDVSEDSDLSDHEVTDLPPSVRSSKKPLDITVTFYDMWSKRGFTALYGVVVVIYVLSKYCGKCAVRDLLNLLSVNSRIVTKIMSIAVH